MKALLGGHPFSALVTVVVLVLAVKLLFEFFNRKNKGAGMGIFLSVIFSH